MQVDRDEDTQLPPEFHLALNKPVEIPGVPSFTVVPEKIVGKGSFGIVYLVRANDGSLYAIKRVLQDRRYKNREFQIMRSLDHPNIVRLIRGYFISCDSNSVTDGTSLAAQNNDMVLNLVMDYVPETVYSIYKQYARLKQHVPLSIVRIVAYQLARSLAYIHAKQISHRDIKPQNVLIDPANSKVVLCDFGSAKRLVPGEPNVAYICSRYYRAPELIVGYQYYTSAVDIWSYGCVIAEMILGMPLFPGETSVKQFVEIVRILGAPTHEDFEALNPSLKETKFRDVKPFPLSKVFKSRGQADVVDLLSKILVYIPSKRLSAIEICAHPFFNPLREEGATQLNGEPLPKSLFEFTQEEQQAAGPELMKRLIPKWMQPRNNTNNDSIEVKNESNEDIISNM